MCNEASDIQFLESVRLKHELTIVAFTNLLPIQRSTFYGWKTGRRKPDPYRMAACLKIAGKMK
jgi:DNA-binding transcriptional regulator YiaG